MDSGQLAAALIALFLASCGGAVVLDDDGSEGTEDIAKGALDAFVFSASCHACPNGCGACSVDDSARTYRCTSDERPEPNCVTDGMRQDENGTFMCVYCADH